MKRLSAFLAFVVFLGLSVPSLADGNEMLRDCRATLGMVDRYMAPDNVDNVDIPGASMCLGYVSGAMHFLDGWLSLHPNDLLSGATENADCKSR